MATFVSTVFGEEVVSICIDVDKNWILGHLAPKHKQYVHISRNKNIILGTTPAASHYNFNFHDQFCLALLVWNLKLQRDQSILPNIYP